MEKAGAILGGHKKRMLVDAGLTVVPANEPWYWQDYELFVEAHGGLSRGDHIDAIDEERWTPSGQTAKFCQRLKLLERLYDQVIGENPDIMEVQQIAMEIQMLDAEATK